MSNMPPLTYCIAFVSVLRLPACGCFFLRRSLWRQTGMRHAYGKPQGTTARVAIGQVCCSSHSHVLVDHFFFVVVQLLYASKSSQRP